MPVSGQRLSRGRQTLASSGCVTPLFNSPVLRVEQPRKGPFAKSQYKVFDGEGTLIAIAAEQERARRETLRTVFPGKSDLDPRAVLLSSPEGDPLLIVDKQQGRDLTLVRRPDGESIGEIRTERVGRRYILVDADGARLGEIKVDLGHNTFTVLDKQGSRVAEVRKKWSGVFTHLLTTADKYGVKISESVAEPLRTLAVATAIAMDMALHESKDLT